MTKKRKIIILALCVFFIALSIRAVGEMPKISIVPLLPDENLSFPVHVEPFPGNDHRFAIVEKTGLIKWAFDKSNKAEGVLLDIQKKLSNEHWEDGLLSLAFDPMFSDNHYYYIWYTAEPATTVTLSRLTMNGDYTTDLASELVILKIAKSKLGHNGGTIKFDKQGLLYLSIGEAMIAEVPQEGISREDLKTKKTLFGSLIRIDVRGATASEPYKIPSDNPFYESAGNERKEIWAYGFRNPWRFSIDPVTQDIYLGDAGRDDYEELNKIEKGGYYGWPDLEGTECPFAEGEKSCDKTGSIAPVAVFDHEQLRAICGGYIYRGEKIPWLKGKYVFSDYIRGIYYIDLDKTDGIIRKAEPLSVKSPVPVGPNAGEPIHVVSMTPDTDNDLYLADIRGGVYRMRDLKPEETMKHFFYHLFRF